MIEPHNIAEREQAIRDLIADAEIGDAIKKLMDFVRDFSGNDDYLNEVTVISADYRTLETEHRRKPMSFASLTKARAKIVFRGLELMRAVANECKAPA